MDADGGNLRRISNAPFPYGDSYPSWSPRGDAIAFASAREGRGREGVYVSDIDGGEEVRITGLDTSVMWSNWRPVGDAIVYASTKAGTMDIHIMDGRGSHLAQLTDDRRWDMTPSWHPRGEAIAFASVGEADVTGDIYTIDADGSNRRRITKHPADESDPCWSPDATQILFESNRDGRQGLFIMDLEGRRIVRRVTDGRFDYIEGSDWYDPRFPRSVSPIGRHAAMWGWIKQLGPPAP
jgi:Tol biopolymer transport system component